MARLEGFEPPTTDLEGPCSNPAELQARGVPTITTVRIAAISLLRIYFRNCSRCSQYAQELYGNDHAPDQHMSLHPTDCQVAAGLWGLEGYLV